MAEAMLIAIAIDIAVGWPVWVFDLIGHPVTWMGSLLNRLDKRLNRGSALARQLTGLGTLLVLVGVSVLMSLLLVAWLPAGLVYALTCGILAAPLIAARGLHEHVTDVIRPLQKADLTGARLAVGRIVGRDPEQLDEAGVARAALESLAENTSDGVIAPLFWGAILGLPGIVAYKAINTADSMIGHLNDIYRDFGRAAARTDDLVNWIPARLTAMLFALVSGRMSAVLRRTMAEARHHRSPNAGWPEAAMAAALGCRLSGPRSYDGITGQEPWLNGDAPDPVPRTMLNGLKLYRRMLVLAAAILFSLTLI
ncbi:adenosylcobinamide-phosphate synthase CbiB [Halovulum sp. GXIMD14793]